MQRSGSRRKPLPRRTRITSGCSWRGSPSKIRARITSGASPRRPESCAAIPQGRFMPENPRCPLLREIAGCAQTDDSKLRSSCKWGEIDRGRSNALSILIWFRILEQRCYSRPKSGPAIEFQATALYGARPKWVSRSPGTGHALLPQGLSSYGQARGPWSLEANGDLLNSLGQPRFPK